MTSTQNKAAAITLSASAVLLIVAGVLVTPRIEARRHAADVYTRRVSEIAATDDASAQFRQQMLVNAQQLWGQGLRGDALARQLKIRGAVPDQQYHRRMKQLEQSELRAD